MTFPCIYMEIILNRVYFKNLWKLVYLGQIIVLIRVRHGYILVSMWKLMANLFFKDAWIHTLKQFLAWYTWANFNLLSPRPFIVRENLDIFKWFWSLDQGDRHTHIYLLLHNQLTRNSETRCKAFWRWVLGRLSMF